MSESPVLNCENCDGKVERIITGGTGLIFKGSGFYLTDYKNGEKSKDTVPNSDQSKNKKLQPDEKSKKENTESEDTSIQKKEKKTDE